MAISSVYDTDDDIPTTKMVLPMPRNVCAAAAVSAGDAEFPSVISKTV